MALKTTAEQRQRAAADGVSMSTIRARMHDGLTFDEALEVILARRDEAVFNFDGVRYPSVNAACTDLGVKNSQVFSLMRNNRTAEEAMRIALGWTKEN